MAVTLQELANAIGAELVGDPNLPITGVNTLEEAEPGQVTFLANPKYLKQLEGTRASAVIVAPSVSVNHVAILKAKDPYYAFSLAVQRIHGTRKHGFAGVHPHATVDSTATIGEGTVIYPGAYVGARVKIGRDCVLHPNVVIYADCVVGDRVIIHANTAIGRDVHEALGEYTVPVLRTTIGQRVAFAESATKGMTVFELDPDMQASQEMYKLVAEAEELLGIHQTALASA